jgi:UBA-like protein
MSEDEIPYLKVRAVRDETGASHEECRQALHDSDGDVDAAVSLWFRRRREASARGAAGAAPPGAARPGASPNGAAPNGAGQDQSQPTRSQ